MTLFHFPPSGGYCSYCCGSGFACGLQQSTGYGAAETDPRYQQTVN